MFAIAILINWNLINLIGEADGDHGGEEDAKVPPSQPVAYSARIRNSVHLSDLRFMVFILWHSIKLIFLQCGMVGRSLNYVILKHVSF